MNITFIEMTTIGENRGFSENPTLFQVNFIVNYTARSIYFLS